MNPGVLHTDKNGNTRMIDMGTRLLCDRVILLTGEINGEVATEVVSQILYLNSENDKEPIQMWIQSPGGECNAGLAIIDAMKMSNAPIYTIGYGMVASMASVILSQGESGHRAALPNTKIMIHQPLGGAKGQISDIEIQYKEGQKIKDQITEMIAKASGNDLKKTYSAMDRDNYLTTEEAMNFGKKGLIDKIIDKLK